MTILLQLLCIFQKYFFQVGYETISSSEDAILKQDMPPALNRVEVRSGVVARLLLR